MTGILDRLARGEVVVGDGAWGTQLMERGLPPGQPPEVVNLERVDILEEIAALYLDAGADLITTNTFGGSPIKLESCGLGGHHDAINRRAVEAARRGARGRALVSASMGPSGSLLRPYGMVEAADMAASFERQAAVLVEAGADVICVETMTDLTEATLAVQAVRRVSARIPVIATMTFERTRRGFFTVMGASVAAAAAGLEAAGANLVGANCGCGFEMMVEIARAFRQQTQLPIAVQANAGLPVIEAGGARYPETPETVAACVPALIDAGAQLIGGCCGTTPAHIRAIRAAVDARAPLSRG